MSDGGVPRAGSLKFLIPREETQRKARTHLFQGNYACAIQREARVRACKSRNKYSQTAKGLLYRDENSRCFLLMNFTERLINVIWQSYLGVSLAD